MTTAFKSMTPPVNREHYFCVILAGGKGRRLWPCSREHHPKQFVDFFGTGKTQLQQTYDRMKRMLPQANIYINTNESYRHLVEEQLPEVAPDHIMAEPIYRNTAPSVAWATHRIARVCPQACLLMVPADQTVVHEDIFEKDVMEAFAFVEQHASLLTMAVKPTRPEPGYGYIQMGEYSGVGDIYQVKTFTEKPDRDFAQLFLDSGEWFWNTGMFVSRLSFLQESLSKLLPPVLREFDEMHPHWTLDDEENYVKQYFSRYPNLSIDFGILEKSEQVYFKNCTFGWADLGTWHGIYEAISDETTDNICLDSAVIFDEAHHNIVKLPHHRLAIIHGLEDYIVAEEDNVLLICKKEDSSSRIRKYITEVELQKGKDFV